MLIKGREERDAEGYDLQGEQTEGQPGENWLRRFLLSHPFVLLPSSCFMDHGKTA